MGDVAEVERVEGGFSPLNSEEGSARSPRPTWTSAATESFSPLNSEEGSAR